MKKIFVALSMVAFLVACDDSSSTSAGSNDEPSVELSSSSSGKVTEPAEVMSSSSEKVKPSSSNAQSNAKQSSSSEKTGTSSSSVDKASSSSVKSESSSSVEDSQTSSCETVENSSSSVNELSSGSVMLASFCKTETEDNCEYDSLTDERDGQIYKTVKIGSQWWMAENLNYSDTVKTPSILGKSWCYNDSAYFCKKYGRLYTWAAAIDSAKLYTEKSIDCGYDKICSLPDTVCGICPLGWHLPSQAEWEMLFIAVGGIINAGEILKSQTGWDADARNEKKLDGTDAVGFSALPAGNRFKNGSFNNGGNLATFWCSTEGRGVYHMFLGIIYTTDGGGLYVYDSTLNGYSVRCVKD